MENLEIIPIINAVYRDIKIESERKNINLMLDIDENID